MADWIKVESDLPTRAEVLAIASEIGRDRQYVAGLLIQVWIWADVPGGYITGGTPAIFDVVFGVGLAKAMENVGWLKVEKDGITIPGFDRRAE